jgi:hypothetical protein
MTETTETTDGEKKTHNQDLRAFLAEFDEEMLFADGYDHCIVGTAYTPGLGTRTVYDTDLIIKELMSGGLSWEEAEEHFSFNIEGGYLGKHTPVFVRRLPQDL